MLKLQFHENDFTTANLYLRMKTVSRLNRLTPSVIDITKQFQPERKRVEAFIKDIYAQYYEADISVTYPTLMSIRNKEGDILAAVGFRYADEEPLFLEQYTEKSIEDVLKTPRNKIVEIGNLASAGGGASIFLFAALASYLNFKEIKYATITGTDSLHHMLKKLGLAPQKLCDASLYVLQNDRENNRQKWGRYYEASPRVLSGSIEQSVKHLRKALGAEYKNCPSPLFSRLHYNS